MNTLDLILVVGLPILALFVFISMYVIIFRIRGQSETSFKGKKFFKVDLFARKLQLLNIGNDQNTIFKNIKPGQRVKFDVLFKRFVFPNDNQTPSNLREFVRSLSKLKKTQSITFDAGLNNYKKAIYRFVVQANYLEDSSDLIASVSWKAVDKKIKEEEVTLLKPNDIIEIKNQYKGFVAFNLKHEVKEAEEKMIRILRDVSSAKFTYFKNNNVLVIVFSNNNKNIVKRNINHLINKFKTKGIKMGANLFYKGSGYMILQEVDSIQNLSRALKGLDFFIIISIDKKVDFISNEDREDVLNDFKTYAKSLSVFRESLRSGEIETNIYPVKNYKTGKKIIEYGYPSVKKVSNSMLEKLLSNRNNLIDLISAHAKKVAVNSEIKKPILIDVYGDWLIKNESKIKYKKAIYVVNISEHTKFDILSQSMKKLLDDKFIFALRIHEFSEAISTLIKQINPQFIVVDESVWDENEISSSSIYLQLHTLNKMVTESKIKVIYENPSPLIDKQMAEKIGLKFTFKRESD